MKWGNSSIGSFFEMDSMKLEVFVGSSDYLESDFSRKSTEFSNKLHTVKFFICGGDSLFASLKENILRLFFKSLYLSYDKWCGNLDFSLKCPKQLRYFKIAFFKFCHIRWPQINSKNLNLLVWPNFRHFPIKSIFFVQNQPKENSRWFLKIIWKLWIFTQKLVLPVFQNKLNLANFLLLPKRLQLCFSYQLYIPII